MEIPTEFHHESSFFGSRRHGQVEFQVLARPMRRLKQLSPAICVKHTNARTMLSSKFSISRLSVREQSPVNLISATEQIIRQKEFI